MTFTGLPIETGPLTFQRVFVERAGKVYFGYQNKNGVSNSAGLNLAGGNALLTKLTIGEVDSETPMALTASSYAGVWDLVSSLTPSAVTRITDPTAGPAVCANVPSTGSPTNFTCIFTVVNPVTGAFSYSDGSGGATQNASGTADFLTGAVTGTFIAGTITGTLSGFRR